MNDHDAKPKADGAESLSTAGLGGNCLICGKPVTDYEAEMCCSGHECVCRGQPMNPCVCSAECSDALFGGIGEDYEQRMDDAGIQRWMPLTPNVEVQGRDAASSRRVPWNDRFGH